MAWFTRDKPAVKRGDGEKRVRTEGLWLKCERCGQIVWRKALENNFQVGPKCGHHGRLDARTRLALLFDQAKFEEFDQYLVTTDPLEFVDARTYRERLAAAQEGTRLRDAIISAGGNLNGRRVHVCAMELKLVGGSMGAVVGEVITRAIERSIHRNVPLIIVSASGGARMQEGAISLMQMAKISAALMRLDEARVPYISVLTDPTTGGVTASFAMLGDLNIAEPGAQIGFAGPRVIEQTIRQKLPAGFQTSEFLLQHGFLDGVVKRADLKSYLSKALDFFLAPQQQNAHQDTQ